MQTVYLLVMILIFIAAVSLGLVCFRTSRDLFFGKPASARMIVLNAAGRGIASVLFLFSGVYLLAVISGKAAQATPDTLAQSFLFFLIPGLIIFLGSLSDFIPRGKKKT